MGKNQSIWDPTKANKQESLAKKTNSPASRGIGSPLKAVGATAQVEAAPTPQHVAQRLFSPSSIKSESKTVKNSVKSEKISEREPKRTDSPLKHYVKKFPQPSLKLVTVSRDLSSDSEIDVEVVLSDEERFKGDDKTVMQVLESKELSKPKGPLRASNADMEIIVSGQMAALANKRSQFPVGRRRRSSTQSTKRGGVSPLKRKKNPRMISKADLDVVTQATRMSPSGKEHRSAALRKKLAAVKLQQKASRLCKKPLKRLIMDKKRKKSGNSSVDSLFKTAVTEKASKNKSENMCTVFSAIRVPILRLTRVQTCPDGTVKLATCSAAQDQPEASLTTNLGPETLTELFKPPQNILELKVDESEAISNDVEENEEPRDLEPDNKTDEKEEQNLEEDEILNKNVKKIVTDEESDVDVEEMDESFDINDMVTLDEIEEVEEEDTLAENSDLLANKDSGECTKDNEAHAGEEKQSLVVNTEKEVVEAQTHVDLSLKLCMNAPKRPCYCCGLPAAKTGKGCIPVAMVSPMVKAPFQPDVPAVTVAPLFAEISLTKGNDECEGAASPIDDNSSQNSENFVLNLNLNSNDFETSVTSVESEPEIATPDPPTQGSSKTFQKLVSSPERRKTTRDDASVDTASNMSKAQARLAELEDWDLEVAKKPPNPVDIEQDVIDDVTILSFTSQEDLLTFPPNATIAANNLQPLKDLVLRKTNDIKQVKGWRRKLAKFNFVPSSNSEEATPSQDNTLALSKPQPPDAFLKPQTARRSKKFMLEARVMNAEYVKFAMQALKLPELAVKVHKLELQEDSVNVNSVIVPVCCSPSPLPENPRGGARRRGKSASKAVTPVATPSVASSEPVIRRRRKRRTDQGPAPTKKVRLELGRLGVQYVEVEQVEVVGMEDLKKSEKTKEGECQEEFCKLGCVCDSLRTSHVVQHCGRADCMFECVCPPDRITRISQASTHKTLLTDAYLNQIEDEGKRNLSKNEKEFFQTVVKKGAEMVVVGEKKQRERRMPNRFRDSVFLVGAEFISSELDSNVKASTSTEGADKRANKFYSSEYSMKSLKDMSGKSPPKNVSAIKASKRAQQASEQATQNLISQKIHKVMQERKLMFKDLVAQEELREGNELDLSIRNQEMIQVIRWVRLQRLLAEEQVSIRYLKRRLHSSIIVSKPQDAVATDITIDVRELKGQEDAPGLVNILFSESMSPSSYAILFCDGVKWELAANLEGQSRKRGPAATPAPSTSVLKLSDSVPAEATPTCTQPSSSSSVSTNKSSSTPSSVSNSSSSLPNPPNCFSVPLSLAPSPVVSSSPSISSSASTEVANTRPAKFSVPIPINKIPRPPIEKSILHSNGPTPRRTYRRYTYVPYKKPENTDKPTEVENPATKSSPRPPSPAPETSKHLIEAKRQLQLALERESLYFPKPLYAALQIGTLPGTSKKHCRMKLILPVTDRAFSQSNSNADARVTCLLPMVSQEDRWCIVALKGVANAGLQMPGTNCPIPLKLMHEAAMVARQKRVRVTLPIKLQKNEPAAEFMLEHFGIYAFPGINEHVFLGPFSTEFLASMAELPRAVRLVPCISSQKTKGKETLAVVRNVLDDLITRVCEEVAAKQTSNAVGGTQEAGPNEKMTSLKVKEFALAQRLAELNKITKTPSLTDVLKTTRVKMVVRGYGANGTTPIGQKAVDKNQSAGAAGPKAKPPVEAPPKTTFVHVDLQSGLKKKIELELNVNGTVTARHPLNPEMRLGFTNVESAKEWFVKYDLDKPRLLKRGARALVASPVVVEEEREEIVVECTPMALEREDEEDEEEDMLDVSEDSNDSEAVKENIGNLASVLAEDYVDVETVSDCEGRLSDLHGPSTSSGIRPGMEQKTPKSRRVVRSMSERARRKQLTILQRNLHTVLNGSDQEGEKTSKVYLMNKAKRTIDVLRMREDELNRKEETLRSLKQTYLKKLRELCEDLGPETRAVADIVMASCAAFETRRVDMLMAVESSYNRQHNLLKPQTNIAPEPKRPAQAKKITKKVFGPCSPPRVEESAPLKRPPRKAYLASRVKTAAPGSQRRAVRSGRGRGRRPAHFVDSDRKDHNYGRPSNLSSKRPCTTFTIQSPDDDSQEIRVVRKDAPPSSAGTEEPEFLPMIASVQSLAGSSFSFDMNETEEMEESGGIELETASVSQDENSINRESVVQSTEINEEAMEDESNQSDSESPAESPKSFIKVSDFAKIVAKHVDAADTKKITVYRTAKAPVDTATSTTPVFKTPVVIARQGGTGNLQVKPVGGANTVQRVPIQKRNLLPISATSTPTKGENPSSSCVKAVLMSVTSFGEHKTAVCKPITSGAPGAGGKRPGVVEFIKVPTRTLVPGQVTQLRSTSAPSIISGAKVPNMSRTSPGTSSPPVMSYVVPFNPGVATKVSVTSAPVSGSGITGVAKTVIPVSGASVYVLPQSTTAGKPVQLTSVYSGSELQRILQSSSGKQIMVFRSKNGKLIPTSTVTTVKSSLSSSTSNAETAKDLTS